MAVRYSRYVFLYIWASKFTKTAAAAAAAMTATAAAAYCCSPADECHKTDSMHTLKSMQLDTARVCNVGS